MIYHLKNFGSFLRSNFKENIYLEKCKNRIEYVAPGNRQTNKKTLRYLLTDVNKPTILFLRHISFWEIPSFMNITAINYFEYKPWKFYKNANLQCYLGEGSSARKNCSTPKSQLLDTVQADDKNIWVCLKIKKVCCTCLVKQMQVLDQNVQLLE